MQEKEKIIFLNLLHDYLKKYKKFPTLKRFANEGPIHKMFIDNIKKEELYETFEQDFRDRLSTSNTKTIKLLREAYEGNKVLFIDFFKVNYKGSVNKEFQRLGKEVLIILQDVENKVVGNMETSQYKTFSTSLTNKYWEIIAQYFPLYNQIGVKVIKKS